ncbi:methionyl-tRNA formyltransferase [Acetobacter orleanensis]|uniref:Methionyl-tRNA formyltransferase n=1 Tax=Acetobacter orleanensis TaxID=104099 RepID=A0A4Y3TKB8_9PROT|nr:methionyl-tRNA formyltransferase [Acetobacter orleanensis]KXV66103.1 methionyl-tRNA formyltransferase [Acetobacter orleanensis]PCD79570.1 methionyl-tRNA formyltransferase [Acetobacter orleanensis]GAN68654.1 methionyl-tRNA formyl transferase [Acetobacter orleanensis JCM 7639]GBR24788.1 methionyl-tRNA formyl transferase [Acetobacter orleanensis NRIC 0473]GEB82372.1 methionyl-tRNA formyltransferase [Acetobacter orleanensis]
MRLIFMGTPDFAVPALHALHAAGHEIVAVYSQPPRPAGRGKALRASPVQQAAEALGLPVRHPEKLRKNEEEWAAFAALEADAAIVAAYGLILPQVMLDAPRLGCLNIHASLLPRWRGASPIQSSILAGDTESGVTIMQMEAGLDTGPMLLREAVPITAKTTATSLHDALSAMGGQLAVRVLAERPAPTPQPENGVTYAPMLTREDGRLDWSQSATALDLRIRALTPWPGTFTLQADGTVLKIGAAIPLPDHTHNASPGTVLDENLTIACGTGALRLTRLQKPGRGMMEADAFLRGQPMPVGTRLYHTASAASAPE